MEVFRILFQAEKLTIVKVAVSHVEGLRQLRIRRFFCVLGITIHQSCHHSQFKFSFISSFNFKFYFIYLFYYCYFITDYSIQFQFLSFGNFRFIKLMHFYFPVQFTYQSLHLFSRNKFFRSNYNFILVVFTGMCTCTCSSKLNTIYFSQLCLTKLF